METHTLVEPRKIEPEHFGPLGEGVLQATGPSRLFAGEERFLKGAALKKRCDLWRTAAPLLDRLLDQDERVLYAAQAVQRPTTFQSMSLGWLAHLYHQVLLVFTGRRIIEVLLDQRGKRPATRIRSFPLDQVGKLSLRFLSLALVPVRGKKVIWSLAGGDRKLLKLLLPRIQERLQPQPVPAQEPTPGWHCPNCLEACVPNPTSCPSCGTLFRSFRLASVLSLAFPGAGLLYAGHPVLAAFDFLGELFVFGFMALMLATAGTDTASIVVFAGMGAFAFALTKFESIHLGHILVTRSRPDDPQRRGLWRKVVGGGGAVSALALIGALALSGTLGAVQKHDIDFVHAGWEGSREASDWLFFTDDPTLRSQWTHDDGWIVSVFAYPLDGLETYESFRRTFREEVARQDLSNVVEDETLPPPVRGFRHVGELIGEGGVRLTAIYYFVYGPESSEVHQLLTVVETHEAKAVESRVQELLSTARWIPALVPEGTVASAADEPVGEIPARL
jgi:hypothetical protein